MWVDYGRFRKKLKVVVDVFFGVRFSHIKPPAPELFFPVSAPCFSFSAISWAVPTPQHRDTKSQRALADDGGVKRDAKGEMVRSIA